MRIRMSGGVVRVIRKDGPYPIYVFSCLKAMPVMRENRRRIPAATNNQKTRESTNTMIYGTAAGSNLRTDDIRAKTAVRT